jgi:hypothetical protein
MITDKCRRFNGPPMACVAYAINYLEASNLDIVLLINFGAKSLEFKWVDLASQAIPSYTEQRFDQPKRDVRCTNLQ